MSGDRLLWPRAAAPASPISVRPLDRVAPASTMGIGELPHLDAGRGVELSMPGFDIPTVPQLPAVAGGSMLTQAFGDLPGVSIDGARLRVDLARLDVRDPAAVDVTSPAYAGFAGVLGGSVVRPHGVVKWQFLGPISGGVALIEAGVEPIDALEISHVTIRRKLAGIAAALDAAAPGTAQICVLDEPHISAVARRSFPLSIDEAVDVLSCAMATVQQVASVGVHTCSNLDIGVLLEAGPELLSVPAHDRLVRGAGRIDRFLAGGGWVAWGAVPTSAPMGTSARRASRQLAQLWGELARHGCDPDRLRSQSIVTSSCGLARCSEGDADRLCRVVGDVGAILRGEPVRSRATFGA